MPFILLSLGITISIIIPSPPPLVAKSDATRSKRLADVYVGLTNTSPGCIVLNASAPVYVLFIPRNTSMSSSIVGALSINLSRRLIVSCIPPIWPDDRALFTALAMPERYWANAIASSSKSISAIPMPSGFLYCFSILLKKEPTSSIG